MDVTVRPAAVEDAPSLTAIADEAYGIYVSRIGRRPAPMVADFSVHIANRECYALEDANGIAAYIVTYPRDSDQFVENVAIRPDRQGQGYGRALMNFAEIQARKNGLGLMVLYTNLKMTENLAFYPRLGYVETKHIFEDGFDRVYFEKRLTP